MTNRITMCLVTGFAVLLSMTASGIADEHGPYIGDGVMELPLFDAHIHYKQPAWEAYSTSDIVDLMDVTGVAMGLVSSTPDGGTIKLWQYAPNRIVPELRPYHDNAGSSNWTKSPGMYDYLLDRLNTYPHEGIGEFHIHQIDPNDRPLLQRIVDLALARDIFIHIHSGKEPVDLLFSLEPKVKIIWAHAGMVEPAETVEQMMTTYETLYADTAYREYDILNVDGTIDPAWRQVLERYPKRFMIGSDTWVNAQWDQYEQIMSANRRWLSQFSRPIAEQIAYKNAERLFGRKVDNNLIGQR